MKKLHFIILVFGLFACNSKTQDNNLQEESEETIIVMDNHESDSIRMWKALAEESIERARRDATIIKESIPKALQVVERMKANTNTTGISTEDAFSLYLAECNVKSAESLVNTNMEYMYDAYNKKQYRSVVRNSDQIEKARIEIQSIIER